MNWNRGFYFTILFTLAALAVLSSMAFRALKVQMSEEYDQKLADALTRAKNTAENISLDFTGAPSLEFLAPELLQSTITIPEIDDEASALLLAAMETENRRLHLLDGLLNSKNETSHFWANALVWNSIRNGELDQAEHDMERAAAMPGEPTSHEGFPLKTLSALKLAKSMILAGNAKKAEKWLLKTASFRTPNTIPEKPVDFWNASGHTRDLAVMVHWYWLHRADAAIDAGWHFHHDIPLFVSDSGGTKRVFLALSQFAEYTRIMQRAIGDGFDLTLTAKVDESMGTLPGLNDRGFVIKPMIHSREVIRSSYGMLSFGVLLALVLIGFSIVSLYAIRRDQESRSLRFQELFFRQAAHDLKTPLTTLRALTETLEMGRFKSEEQKNNYYTLILGEIDRSSEMVDTMLMTARLQTRMIEPRRELISVANALKMILSRFVPRFNGWKTDCKCPDDLQLSADPEMWERTIVNMIENVLRHASAGKELQIEVLQAPQSVEIKVGDRGNAGVLPAIHNRWNSEPLPGEGHRKGWGLFLIGMIMQIHGGSLDFEIREGGGIWVVTKWPGKDID